MSDTSGTPSSDDFLAEAPSVDALQSALDGDFEIHRLLGEGSMAVVYLATEKGLDRQVAVKVLKRSHAASETARARFEREARSSASLSHPKIVQVYRYGRLPDDTPYLVMRYVKGRTMEERVEAEGRLDLRTARKTLKSVASALAAAHKAGIIHRDIRPANVLWDDEGKEALLSDFGIAALQAPTGEQAARLTTIGQVIGNPRYLSPEQLREESITEMVDIYAFGILGYELLSGRGPYDGTNNAQLMAAHLQAEPRPLDELRGGAPADIADLLRRCLNKEPKKRPRAVDIERQLEESDPETSGAYASVPRPGQPDPTDIGELVKRRVPQIVISTAVAGGTTILAVSELDDRLPESAFPLTVALAIAALFASMVIGWFHGEKGEQTAPTLEYVLLGVIGVGWLAATVWILVG
ncbi:MAG TPA: serine/threonine-protein kinase [Longimicrobiales bacterium]|nr:serine/threonine-protein kinase [Longimicrobiales bacterium]